MGTRHRSMAFHVIEWTTLLVTVMAPGITNRYNKRILRMNMNLFPNQYSQSIKYQQPSIITLQKFNHNKNKKNNQKLLKILLGDTVIFISRLFFGIR